MHVGKGITVRAFIYRYRHAYGVEPICKGRRSRRRATAVTLPKQRKPALRCARVQRDDVLGVSDVMTAARLSRSSVSSWASLGIASLRKK